MNMRAAWKQAMKAKRITQVMLSELTGIAQPSLSEYLTGRVDPRLSTCEKISKALGVELAPEWRVGKKKARKR